MKKYLIVALLAFSAFGFTSAQTIQTQVGDVEDTQLTCTELSYTLKLRSKDATTNNEVTELQNFLLDIGLLDSDPTGYFGAATLKAVKTFQRQNGLIASGLVGSFTRKAIKEKSCNTVTKKTTEQASTECTQTPDLCNPNNPTLPEKKTYEPTSKKVVDTFTPNNGSPSIQVYKVSVPYIYITYKNVPRTETQIVSVANENVEYGLGVTISGTDSTTINFSKLAGLEKDLPTGYYYVKAGEYARSEKFYIGGKDVTVTPTPTEVAHGPGYNAMLCSKPAQYGLANGQVGCYGIWDYGNEFGGDPDMCPQAGYGYERKTGCIVSTNACASGKAVASKMVYPTSMDINSSEIALYAKSLKSTPSAVKQQIPTLWEYTCTDGSTVSPLSDTSTFKEEAIGFGVYEGVDASVAYAIHPEYQGTGPSEPVSGHPERVVYISVPQSAANKVLVLTSYEPTNWILANLSAVRPSKIIIVGYHYQRLTTVDSSPLPNYEINSYQQNKVAKFAYKTSDQYFSELSSWLASKGISLKPENFTGTYSAKDNQIFMVPGGTSVPSVNTSDGAGAYNVPTNQQVLGESTMCVNLTTNLHRGDESSQIKLLQTFLSAKGLLNDSVTGFFGDKTVSAVKLYQRSKGLPETGMVYDFTRESITAETCN